MRCVDGIADSMDMNLGKLLEMVRDREAWHAAVHGVTKEQDKSTHRNPLHFSTPTMEYQKEKLRQILPFHQKDHK